MCFFIVSDVSKSSSRPNRQGFSNAQGSSGPRTPTSVPVSALKDNKSDSLEDAQANIAEIEDSSSEPSDPPKGNSH